MELIKYILFAWNTVGGIILITTKAPLDPRDVYDDFLVNRFGCALITIAMNLLSPVASIIYWFVRFIDFIMTTGRKY